LGRIGEADKVPFVWPTSKGVDLNGQRNFGWGIRMVNYLMGGVRYHVADWFALINDVI
jgi:hypothetical protein